MWLRARNAAGPVEIRGGNAENVVVVAEGCETSPRSPQSFYRFHHMTPVLPNPPLPRAVPPSPRRPLEGDVEHRRRSPAARSGRPRDRERPARLIAIT
jgi:hypothetical protein